MNAPANVERQASDEPYVIRKGASFYKPNFAGYTSHIGAAGIYSKEQALAVAEDRRSYAGATPPHEVSAQPLSDFAQEIEEASRLLAEKRAALGMAPLVTLDAAPTTDDAEAQIEARHRLDAFWFTGGLHDPNSYVVMAHKDRGALLDRWRRLVPRLLKAETGEEIEAITIPKAAYDWLMGEGPDDRGQHFCDSRIDHMGHTLGGKFWWRTTFRRMCGR